jgi:hypothetical protein
MSSSRIILVLLATFTLAAVPAASQVPPDAHQWEVPHANGVSYAIEYMLFNQKNKSQIGYENRKAADEVDLDWVGNFGGLFSFMREAAVNTRDHRPGPIRETENVAIYNTEAKRYLKYRGYDDVAELEWSNTPAYEWHLRDQQGSSVASFALYNRIAVKYLVLQTKTRGINLGFAFKQGYSPPLVFSVSLSPQQIAQGWIPYLGSFGQDTGGYLLSVQNASWSHTLRLVKPNGSTNPCGVLNASVSIEPAARMTTDQMRILYGSETPLLPITFIACFSPNRPQPTGPTNVKIGYRLWDN